MSAQKNAIGGVVRQVDLAGYLYSRQVAMTRINNHNYS